MKFVDIFEKIRPHIVSVKWVVDCPYNDEGTIVLADNIWTMDDGTEIKYAEWTSGSLCVRELTVNKEKYGKNIGYDFTAYLNSKGLPTENCEELLGNWQCSGEVSSEDESFIQYTQVSENFNEKFDNAFYTYFSTDNEEEKEAALDLMIEMYNMGSLKQEEYNEKYDCIFPEMSDPTFHSDEPVDLDEFFGFHVELDDL